MAIFIDDIEHYHDFDPAASPTSRSLIGNVYMKIKVEVTGYSHVFVDCTTDKVIEFAADGFGGNDHISVVDRSGDFQEFAAGDTIAIIGSTSNDGVYTVVEKISDSTIRINGSLTNELSTSSTFVNALRDHDSATFKYGLMENAASGDYTSNLDSSIQQWYVESENISGSGVPVGQYKSWLTNLDTFDIILGGVNNNPALSTYGRQIFQFTHEFFFDPFYGHAQNVPPSYFLNDNALKYGFQLLLKENANALTNFQQLDYSDSLGNTGWLGERYNTGVTNYSIKDLEYERVSDSAIVDGILLTDTDQTRVSLIVENTTDSPFTGGSQAFVSVHYVPQQPDEYQNLPTYLNDNLYFDRAFNTEGAGLVNGEFARFIESMVVVESSTTELIVSFVVNLDSGDFAELFSKDDPEYIITVGVHDPNKTLLTGEGVTLEVDKRGFEVNLGLAELTQIESDEFFQHYDTASPTLNESTFFKEDEFVLHRRIKVDTQVSQYEPILKSVTAGVMLRNVSTGFTQDLYTYTHDATLDPIVNDLAVIDAEIETSYQVGDTDQLALFKVSRDLPADLTDQWFYDLEIPIITRWEFWEANNQIPDELFDNTLPNNNLNNDWNNKDTSGFEIYAFTRFIIELNGENYASENYVEIDILDYDEGADWTPFTCTITDLNDNPLPANTLLGFDDVKVIFSTDYIGGSLPNIADVEFVLRIEPTQNGGHFTSQRISTVKTTPVSVTPFTEPDGGTPLLATKTFVGGATFEVEAVLKGSQLADFNEFDITARVYDKRGGVPASAKLTEADVVKLLEDGSIKETD